jgi:ubiquinone/menaquinone biosynthesis C-methylase UbiE
VERLLEATAAAEENHFWFLHLRRTARSLLSMALAGIRPRLIVDCGTGTGRNLEWLAEFGPAVGMERSPTGLAFGRRQGRRMLQGSVTHLPFADGVADVVTSFDVLQCLDDLEERQAVREMSRILAFDGVAVINVAALDFLRGSHSTLTHERRRYTRRRLTDRLEDEGFSIERVTYTNMAIFPLALAVRMRDRVTGRAGTPSDADLRVPAAPVNTALNTVLAVEHAWLRFANLPIGSSVMAVARKKRG